MKLRAIALVGGLSALAAVAVFVSIATPPVKTATIFDRGPPPPSDMAMIAHWEKHRDALDKITDMLRSDPALNRFGLTWSDPADPERAHVSAARLADYRDLMREASIIGVSRGHRSVQFLFHAGGVVGGFGKSFVRGEASRHGEVIDGDLDAAAKGRSKLLLQRPIAEGWWLQREGS
jgi:hypothetical protein